MSGWLIVTAVATAFNLSCTGEYKRTDVLGAQPPKEFSHNLRIDLDAKKWCEGECKRQWDIKAVEPTIITFEDKTEETSAGVSTTKWTINRETANYSYVYTSRDRLMVTVIKSGKCEKSDFTGFPTIETKF